MKIALITNTHRGDDIRLYHKLGLALGQVNRFKLFAFNGQTPAGSTQVAIMPSRSKLKNLWQLYKAVKRFKPDAIIAVEPLTLFLGLLLKRLLHCQLYWDCHEYFSLAAAEKSPVYLAPLAKKMYDVVLHRASSICTGVIAVNKEIETEFRQYNNNVLCLPNYPDLPQQDPDFSITPKYDLVYAGGLAKAKGLFLLLESLHLLRQQGVTPKVLIVGKFLKKAEQATYKQLVKTYGLEQQISFHRFLPASKVKQMLTQAKIGVCMHDPAIDRYTRGLPLKLLEYMAAGLPVISNNFAVITNVLGAYPAGLTIDYTAKALADAINQLLQQPLLPMRQQAIQAIKQKYNWQALQPELQKFIKPRQQLLLFSYFYPPLGGPGVQRPLKTVKAFYQKGWITDIISVGDIVFHSKDNTLLSENRARTVKRTYSLDPMFILKRLQKLAGLLKQLSGKNKPAKADGASRGIYFSTPEKIKRLVRNAFFVDDKIGWLPFALGQGLIMCRRNSYKAIMATMGPYTSGVAAWLLSHITGLPLVIDYRDHWTLNPYLEFPSYWHQRLAEYLERRMIERASLVTVISKTMANQLTEKYGTDSVKVIYNGYDEADFAGREPAPNSKIRFAYIGNFYGHRSPKWFIEALKNLKQHQRLPKDVEVLFIGNYYQDDLAYLQDTDLKDVITIIPQVTHGQAVQHMLDTNILLLFIATPKGKGVLTGKVFEYIRARRPIMAMIPPEGEAAELLKQNGYYNVCPMEDSEAIASQFITLYQRAKAGQTNIRPTGELYSRSGQAMELLAELNSRLGL